MKVLLVDDNALYLEGMASFLLAEGIEVAGTAGDGLEALAKVEMLRPDVILMDVEMPGCNGIEATRIIKRDFPKTEIIMLTIYDEDEQLFAAIRAGASGYLLKSMEAGRFLTELRRLAAGETPLAPGLARRILQEFSQLKNALTPEAGSTKLKAPLPVLTDRQDEILRHLAEGLTYREIGAKLKIQEVTVRYHVHEIMGKLHLANRAQLIAHAARLNL